MGVSVFWGVAHWEFRNVGCWEFAIFIEFVADAGSQESDIWSLRNLLLQYFLCLALRLPSSCSMPLRHQRLGLALVGRGSLGLLSSPDSHKADHDHDHDLVLRLLFALPIDESGLYSLERSQQRYTASTVFK